MFEKVSTIKSKNLPTKPLVDVVMDGPNNINVMFVFLLLLTLSNVDLCICRASSNVQCIPSERDALLKMKHHLLDPSNRLFSWSANGNCCNWASVVCNNITGHILGLQLSTSLTFIAYEESQFGGEVHSSLLGLKHLNYLDLSGNYFLAMQIPGFLGSMTSLTYLNLSQAWFGGSIPLQFWNLSNLIYLDLKGNHFYGSIPHQIGMLTKLQYLDLGENYFNGSIPHHIGSLSNLLYLDLGGNDFSGSIPHQIGNLSNLLYLDFGGNYFNGSIPHQIGNLSNLIHLHLQGSYKSYSNALSTSIEDLQWLSALSLLKYLELNSVNLSNAFDWFQVLHSFPSLRELHLTSCHFNPHFQPSTMNFSSIVVLDLSGSAFGTSLIPNWIFQLKKLVHLQLSSNGFHGSIPDGIQNLTLLQHLELSENLFNSSIPDWLYKLSSLVTLDLTDNFLQGPIPSSLGNLCSLKKVNFSNNKFNQNVFEVLKALSRCASQTLEVFLMSNCQLSSHLTDQIGHFKNLVELDLSENSIQGPISSSLGNLASLKYLDLSHNAIQGPLPSSLGTLTSLIYLSLWNNSINNAIPVLFENLTSLIYLDLSRNRFEGNPFEILRALSKLKTLYLEYNHFHGVVKEAHLINFTHLVTLSASGNQLTLEVGRNWSPPFQLLNFLDMASWNLGPHFPSWIQSLKHLEYLDMSNSKIFDSIPTWFWGTIEKARYLNLSHNHIEGELANILINTSSICVFDLSSNKLNGQLPYISQNVIDIDLSSNQFSGSITHFLCHKKKQINWLMSLNLASNNLSSQIPDCWMMWPNLLTLNLENNQLIGILPTSMGSLPLKVLHLHNNNFFGRFPSFLKKTSDLISLNLEGNSFSGMIPSWFAQRLSNLKILILRANKFSGPIPHRICDMISLQILDLAQNELIGHIPKCVGHFRAMSIINNSLKSYISYPVYNNLELVVEALLLKGRTYDYSRNLGLVTSIDFSSNKLYEEIPMEITRLKGLRFLNLSNNHFIGQIPQTIGDMESLESLDFSTNHLSGEIPPSISKLSFLSLLNLSYNHLMGKIPTGTQLQSFDESSFVGNNLCGPPLNTNCTPNGPDHEDKEANHGNGINWFLVSMAFGFIVGFWMVVGPLLYNRSWRYAYFHFLYRVWYRLESCCY